MLQFWKKTGLKEKLARERSNSTSPVKVNPPGSPTTNGIVTSTSNCSSGSGSEETSRFHDDELAVGDLGESEGSPTGLPKVTSKSRLSKTLSEVLCDKGALGYFIQYLEARDSIALIKFWLDVESFKTASAARVRSESSVGKLSCVPVTSDQLEGGTNNLLSCHHDQDKVSLGTDSDSCIGDTGSVFESPLHSSLLLSESLTKKNVQLCLDKKDVSPGAVSVSSKESDSVVPFSCQSNTCERSGCSDECNIPGRTDPCSSSISTQNCPKLETLPLCSSMYTKGPIISKSSNDVRSVRSSVSDEHLLSPSRANKLIQATLNDAVRIFKKYIASNAPYRIRLPDDIRNKIVDSICKEDGLVDSDCFTESQTIVFHVMEKEYFNDFLRSDFHCKHQIDVLTSGNVYLSDILYNETALFYFMEFMEQEGNRNLLEFWMSAENFHQQLMSRKGNYDVLEAQSDAIILYDKYFSLQATCPLGFSDKIRLEVEQNICRDGGPLPDCYKKPVNIVLHYLEKNYLTTFLTSQLYFNYLSELINTIQSSSGLLSKSRKSGSECSSGLNISIQNTLLAMEDSAAPPRKILRNVDEREMSIDSRQLYDPDSLWKRRQQSGLSFGRINSLGRFERDVEQEPSKKEESRLTKVVKKLVNMEEDKAKEEMAWQVAEMIVKDITNLTMGSDDEQS
ncbi:hypothetical protein R5R35_009880 [Gryllus longicercus]|uniref:RGS domain-containing protein n=1 Tax=Gryllus longicercus TaxID=2509291 RepID=A0AAN9VUY8_9ORTH